MELRRSCSHLIAKTADDRLATRGIAFASRDPHAYVNVVTAMMSGGKLYKTRPGHDIKTGS